MPCLCSFTMYYDKFGLSKSSGPKHHAVLLTVPIFCRFMCVSHRSWWGGSSYSSFLPTPGRTHPHPDFSLQYPSLTAVGRSAHRFVGLLAHRPWANGLQKGRECYSYGCSYMSSGEANMHLWDYLMYIHAWTAHLCVQVVILTNITITSYPPPIVSQASVRFDV
jgi:hypothetical protein